MSVVAERKSVVKPFLFSHGTLMCRDMAKSRRFYEEFLGVEVVRHARPAMMLRLNTNMYVVCVCIGEKSPSQHVMTHWRGEFLYMMPGVFGAARSLGAQPAMAFDVQLVVSLVAAAALIALLLRQRDPLERAGAVFIGNFLVSPYAFNYDMGAMSVVAACLALRASESQRGWAMGIFGVLAVLPAAV